MKKIWISLLIALCFTLSTMIGVMAETNDEIDLAIDYEEMNINTELGDLDISQEDELELSTLRNLDDSIVLDDTLNEYNMLQADAPVTSNSFTDGDYDHDAFEIDENGVLVKYHGDGGKVVIPSGVIEIGEDAFIYSNITSVVIPNSVKKIGLDAFQECEQLVRVTIGKGVTSIDWGAFRYCKKLKNINIPDNVIDIDEETFVYCDSLTDVSIGSGVKSIGAGAFSGCNRLQKIKVSPKNRFFASVNGILFNYKLTTLLCWPGAKADAIIPEGTQIIGEQAFYYHESLKSVVIPESVTHIEDWAFGWCEQLTQIILFGDDVKIGNDSHVFWKHNNELTFYTDIGNKIAQWAKSHGYKVDTILSSTNVKTSVGNTFNLEVRGIKSRNVSWSSSNKEIATVNNGIVKAIKFGKCSITAQLNNGKKYTCKVTVTDTVKLSKTSLTLIMGKTSALTVSGLEGRKVTWSSSNEKVATVERGKITAIKAGKCTITAKLSDGKELTCKVTVTDPAKLSKASLSLIVGKTSTLTVSGLEGRKVTWSSSNEKVATVNRGKVKAVGAGKCNIVAKIENTKLSCAVTVTKPLTGDIHNILGKNMNSINKRLPDKLRYFDEDAYTNDYFLVQTNDSNDIISIALLTDAETGIGKYTLYGLYPGMSYDKARKLLSKSGWKLDSESYDKSYFYNPKDSNVSFYVTIIDDEIDLIVYMYT